jgi:hypothetical protein
MYVYRWLGGEDTDIIPDIRICQIGDLDAPLSKNPGALPGEQISFESSLGGVKHYGHRHSSSGNGVPFVSKWFDDAPPHSNARSWHSFKMRQRTPLVNLPEQSEQLATNRRIRLKRKPPEVFFEPLPVPVNGQVYPECREIEIPLTLDPNMHMPAAIADCVSKQLDWHALADVTDACLADEDRMKTVSRDDRKRMPVAQVLDIRETCSLPPSTRRFSDLEPIPLNNPLVYRPRILSLGRQGHEPADPGRIPDG